MDDTATMTVTGTGHVNLDHPLCGEFYGHRWDLAIDHGVREYACQRCSTRAVVLRWRGVTVLT